MIELNNLVWVVALLYIFFDVNYFIRSLFTIVIGNIFHKRCKISDTTTLYGVCLTNDVDVVLCHMNNARYLRELDFARYHFYERTGLFGRLFGARTITLQTASCIRYRQSIGVFAIYKILTKMIYWDARNVYLEHRFITSDGCVRAVALSRQTILRGTVTELLQKDGLPPRPTSELERWMSSMEASSEVIKSTGEDDTEVKQTINEKISR